MMDLAMVITTVAIMYITAWSLHHDKMSGIMPSLLAAMATVLIVLETTAYAVIFLPVLPWEVSAAVFLAVATLFTTCSLARSAEARNLRDKSR